MSITDAARWPCPRCGTTNAPDTTSCMVCGHAGAGAPLPERGVADSRSTASTDVGPAPAAGTAEAVLRGTLVSEDGVAARLGGPSLTPSAGPPGGVGATDTEPTDDRRNNTRRLAVLAVVIVLVTAAIAVFALMRSAEGDQEAVRTTSPSGTTTGSTTTTAAEPSATAPPPATAPERARDVVAAAHPDGYFVGNTDSVQTVRCEGLRDSACPGPQQIDISCVLSCSARVYEYDIPLEIDGGTYRGTATAESGYTCDGQATEIQIELTFAVTSAQPDDAVPTQWRAASIEGTYTEQSLPNGCRPIVTEAVFSMQSVPD